MPINLWVIPLWATGQDIGKAYSNWYSVLFNGKLKIALNASSIQFRILNNHSTFEGSFQFGGIAVLLANG